MKSKRILSVVLLIALTLTLGLGLCSCNKDDGAKTAYGQLRESLKNRYDVVSLETVNDSAYSSVYYDDEEGVVYLTCRYIEMISYTQNAEYLIKIVLDNADGEYGYTMSYIPNSNAVGDYYTVKGQIEAATLLNTREMEISEVEQYIEGEKADSVDETPANLSKYTRKIAYYAVEALANYLYDKELQCTIFDFGFLVSGYDVLYESLVENPITNNTSVSGATVNSYVDEESRSIYMMVSYKNASADVQFGMILNAEAYGSYDYLMYYTPAGSEQHFLVKGIAVAPDYTRGSGVLSYDNIVAINYTGSSSSVSLALQQNMAMSFDTVVNNIVLNRIIKNYITSNGLEITVENLGFTAM